MYSSKSNIFGERKDNHFGSRAMTPVFRSALCWAVLLCYFALSIFETWSHKTKKPQTPHFHV